MTRFGKISCVALLMMYQFLSGCQGQESSNSRANNQDVDKTAPDKYGMPATLVARDTSAAWHEPGQKLLVTGTVYKAGGKIPAPGVIIYYYHTNTAGKYQHKPKETRSLPPNRERQTHGYIRGWVKSDSNGRYAIYTLRPGVYPTRDEPAHIHLTLQEPALEKSYYIDEFVFDDDPLLTSAKRKKLENRGGSGMLRVLIQGDLQIAEHDIILGLNIPDYQAKSASDIQSGPEIGEDQPSFTPFHAFGPDKGSKACPVCKYGRYHGILYFVGDHPDWASIKTWLTFLDEQSSLRRDSLKAYFVYGNSDQYDDAFRNKMLLALGNELGLKNLALTFVPSFSDTKSDIALVKINPSVENTFIIYRHRTVVGKFINLAPTKENFEQIVAVLQKTKGDFFHLQEPAHD
ncbi:MAG: intradiol ring-cleavage dioxygenase [Bacteroidota bacterium]